MRLVGPDVDGGGGVGVSPVGDAWKAALVGRRGIGVGARVDGRAARQQGVRLCGAAVVSKQTEPRIGVEQVITAEATTAAGIADQVVTLRDEGPFHIRLTRAGIARNNAITDARRGTWVEAKEAAAADRGRVGRDGAGDEIQIT